MSAYAETVGFGRFASAIYSQRALYGATKAVTRFHIRIAEYANGTWSSFRRRIGRMTSPATFAEFEEFRPVTNPNIRKAAIDEMLQQLTERIPRGTRDIRASKNCGKSEKVIDSLTSAHFNRREFPGRAIRLRTSIENATNRLADQQKQCISSTRSMNVSARVIALRVADPRNRLYPTRSWRHSCARTVELCCGVAFGQSMKA